MDPIKKLQFFEADIDRDINNHEILKNGGKLKRFDTGCSKGDVLKTNTKRSRSRSVNITSTLNELGEMENHDIPDMQDINSSSATGQFVDRTHKILRGFKIINVGKNDGRRFMSDEYGLKAAIKHSQESNARDGRACVLTTPGALILAIGYTEKATPNIKDYTDKRLLMHPIEEAALTTDLPHLLKNGKCYTTHLPCYRCIHVLAFLKIKEVIYIDDDNNYLNQEYKDTCKLLNITIKSINRKIIEDIIEDDHRTNFVDLDTKRQPLFQRTQVFPYTHPLYTDPNPTEPVPKRPGIS